MDDGGRVQDSSVWKTVNALRERVTTLEGRANAQDANHDRLAVSLDRLAAKFDRAINLGYGLLGGLVVNLVLMVVQLLGGGL